jgi:hypothetical protein
VRATTLVRICRNGTKCNDDCADFDKAVVEDDDE